MSISDANTEREVLVAKLRTEAFLCLVRVNGMTVLEETLNILAVGCSMGYFSNTVMEDMLSESTAFGLGDEGSSHRMRWLNGRRLWPTILESVVNSVSNNPGEDVKARQIDTRESDSDLMDEVVDLVGRMSGKRMTEYRSALPQLKGGHWKDLTREISAFLVEIDAPATEGNRRIKINDWLASIDTDFLDDCLKFEKILEDFELNTWKALGRQGRPGRISGRDSRILDELGDSSLAAFLSLGGTPRTLVARLPDRYRGSNSNASKIHYELVELANAFVVLLASELNIPVEAMYGSVHLGKPSPS